MNYKNFYNAWHGFAKPKRQLLLERTEIAASIKPEDFLALTADAAEMEKIKKSFAETKPDSPEIVNDRFTNKIFNPKDMGAVSLSVKIDPAGNAEVFEHEGRHRCYAVILYNEKIKNKVIKNATPIQRVPLAIIVPDRNDAKFSEIKQFTSTITSAVVSRINIWSREAEIDEKNPLGIEGNSETIKGYSTKSEWKNENGGFRYWLQQKYNKDTTLRNKYKTYQEFANLINNVYTITDSSGTTYKLAETRLDPNTNKDTGGMLFLNLDPHPVAKYNSIEAANEQTYTIKKK